MQAQDIINKKVRQITNFYSCYLQATNHQTQQPKILSNRPLQIHQQEKEFKHQTKEANKLEAVPQDKQLVIHQGSSKIIREESLIDYRNKKTRGLRTKQIQNQHPTARPRRVRKIKKTRKLTHSCHQMKMKNKRRNLPIKKPIM